MTESRYTIQDASGNSVSIILQRDGRLKKTSRWVRQNDGSVLLRVPPRIPRRILDELLKRITEQLSRQEVLAVRRTDTELQARAEQLNRKYFQGTIRWQAIRWVENMQQRLGSCTRGGATDGHIRISTRIRGWPDWVVDYVIAHELLHRLHPNHSDVFWDELKRAYPLTERAIGFIKGIGFSQGQSQEDDQ
jgi:predicted metal-dependent hydrolase